MATSASSVRPNATAAAEPWQYAAVPTYPLWSVAGSEGCAPANGAIAKAPAAVTDPITMRWRKVSQGRGETDMAAG